MCNLLDQGNTIIIGLRKARVNLNSSKKKAEGTMFNLVAWNASTRYTQLPAIPHLSGDPGPWGGVWGNFIKINVNAAERGSSMGGRDRGLGFTSSLSLVVFVYYLAPPFWEHLHILVRHFCCSYV